MLIRSQDKKILVDMNTVIIHILDRYIACYDPSCISDDVFLYLGSYETKAKAMKVLDMIQDAYEIYEYEKVFKTGLTLFETFQMPADSEVEV